MKIGAVLDVNVCLHQERYGIEILIESLFRDGNSFFGSNFVNGMNKNVTETSETISETCCKSKVTTEACCDVVSNFYSSS